VSECERGVLLSRIEANSQIQSIITLVMDSSARLIQLIVSGAAVRATVRAVQGLSGATLALIVYRESAILSTGS
jgi:hypothetical protein